MRNEPHTPTEKQATRSVSKSWTQRKKEIRSQENLAQPHKEMVLNPLSIDQQSHSIALA